MLKDNDVSRTEGRISLCRKIIYGLLFLGSAFAGALFFSETTSPLFSDWGYDSAMFQTIGKYWAEGYLPYVSLFDHKGPVIFFINAIGYAVCGRTGVFIIQVLSLAVCVYLAYRLLSMRCPRAVSLLAALALPFILAANWQEGNTTEEYILPLLFASYMGMFRWCCGVEHGEYEHAPRFAFIYGMGFAFALLTRVTNALGICLGVAFIVVTLIVRGRWKNLGQNALSFILGAAVLIVPFCVYFAAHGALYDMWYGTLLFNFDYSSNSGTAAPDGIVALLVLLRRYLTGWCLIAASAWGLITRRKGRIVSSFWLLISAVNTLFMYTLNDYAHYGIVLLPFFYLAVCELRAPALREKRRKLSAVLAVCMGAAVLASSALKVYKAHTEILPMQAYEIYGDDYHELTDMIPEDGRESFVAFDCPRRLYLDTGLRPAFRFFTLQQWMSVNSPAFAETIHREFDESGVEWVLTFNLYSVPLVTTDIIEAKYVCVAQSENGIYRLYHLAALEPEPAPEAEAAAVPAQPLISLNGGSELDWPCGIPFTEPGCCASGSGGEDISGLVESEGGVRCWCPGDYELSYTVEDGAGLTAQCTRTVRVVPVELPETVQEDKVIYLTFDDGPCEYTRGLLDVLERYGAKATFFVIAKNNAYMDVLPEILAAGHSIGIHAYDHNYGMLYSAPEAYIEDLVKARMAVYDETGYYAEICRFPGGSTTAANMLGSRDPDAWNTVTSSIRSMGMRYYDWNVKPENSACDVNSFFLLFTEQVRKAAVPISLQHDTRYYSVMAVERLLKWGTENGYSFKGLDTTVPECHDY